jgi:dihydrolipoamide dehydrogenase
MDRGFIQIDPMAAPSRRASVGDRRLHAGALAGAQGEPRGRHRRRGIAQELGNKDVHPHPLDRNNIPGCTYCRPQIASVGLTEAKAKEAGHEVKVGTFPFIGNGKAIALGEAEGFVKTVFDAKTGELLGAHMVGAEVTELIQGFIGKVLETTEAELMQTDLPAPDDQRDRCTKRARRLRPRAAHLTAGAQSCRLCSPPLRPAPGKYLYVPMALLADELGPRPDQGGVK